MFSVTYGGPIGRGVQLDAWNSLALDKQAGFLYTSGGQLGRFELATGNRKLEGTVAVEGCQAYEMPCGGDRGSCEPKVTCESIGTLCGVVANGWRRHRRGLFERVRRAALRPRLQVLRARRAQGYLPRLVRRHAHEQRYCTSRIRC